MRELLTIGATGIAAMALCALLLGFFIAGYDALQGWLWATALWLLGWWQAWRRRALNRPDLASRPFTELGWANRLTLLRGGLIALVGGFLFSPFPAGAAGWLPGLLYGAAVLLDGIDGVAARRGGRVSLLGKELDTEIDALGLLVAPLLAVTWSALHWSFLTVSAAYYVFVAGLHWRRHHRLPVYPLPPSASRRTLAGFQMGLAALVLLPVFSSAASRLVGVVFMMPILAGFLMDWLAVCGQVSVTDVLKRRLEWFGTRLFLPALRLLLGLLVLQNLFEDTSLLDMPQLAVGGLAFLIMTGSAARVASAALLIVGCYLAGDSLTWQGATILFACSWIALLGSGQFSCWRGDDRWLERRT